MTKLQFLSTLPARGATRFTKIPETTFSISIHAPREGSDFDLFAKISLDTSISIHAPREGSDVKWERKRKALREISIHAPREGSDLLRIFPAVILA